MVKAAKDCSLQRNSYLFPQLSNGKTVSTHLLVDSDTNVFLNYPKERLLTGGVQHALSDGALEPRAGVDEHCRRRREGVGLAGLIYLLIMYLN